MPLLLYSLYINFFFSFSSANTYLNSYLLSSSLNGLRGSFRKFQPFIISVQLSYSSSNFKSGSYIVPSQTAPRSLMSNKSNSYSSCNRTISYSPLTINYKSTSVNVCFLTKILLLSYATLPSLFVPYRILNLYVLIYKTRSIGVGTPLYIINVINQQTIFFTSLNVDGALILLSCAFKPYLRNLYISLCQIIYA